LLVLAASALLLTLVVLLCMDDVIPALVSLLVKPDPGRLGDQAPRGFHAQVGQTNLFLHADDEGG
jgi:hypothetical protein